MSVWQRWPCPTLSVQSRFTHCEWRKSGYVSCRFLKFVIGGSGTLDETSGPFWTRLGPFAAPATYQFMFRGAVVAGRVPSTLGMMFWSPAKEIFGPKFMPLKSMIVPLLIVLEVACQLICPCRKIEMLSTADVCASPQRKRCPASEV